MLQQDFILTGVESIYPANSFTEFVSHRIGKVYLDKKQPVILVQRSFSLRYSDKNSCRKLSTTATSSCQHHYFNIKYISIKINGY